LSADEAFAVFRDYFEMHEAAFTEPIRKKIRLTATAVARAFAGENKAESRYLKELKRMVG
jgi:DNA-binding transcriptional regulator GbsR (MarR family)